MRYLLIKTIHLYRIILSPWIGQQCRFTPSCSHYTEEAIQKHGVIKGVSLGFYRIVRCNPWAKAGYDPVPDNKKAPANSKACSHCTESSQGIS